MQTADISFSMAADRSLSFMPRPRIYSSAANMNYKLMFKQNKIDTHTQRPGRQAGRPRVHFRLPSKNHLATICTYHLVTTNRWQSMKMNHKLCTKKYVMLLCCVLVHMGHTINLIIIYLNSTHSIIFN